MGKRTVTIHQPSYLPWVPYFDKILRSDLFVFLDDVQFQKNGMQNRNQVKTPAGAVWLTVPVTHSFGQTIRDTKIADARALVKHVKTLKMNYAKSSHCDEVTALLEPHLTASWDNLADLNCAITEAILGYLGYKGDIVRSSELKAGGTGSDLVLDICRKCGADVYLSGAGGKNYMVLEDFEKAGIEVVFQSYSNVEYPQLHPKAGFIADLSVVDALYNCGAETVGVIERGRL